MKQYFGFIQISALLPNFVSNHKTLAQGDKVHHNRIKIILAEKDISQTKLSELTGISRNSISGYCRNSSQPSLETLRMIAVALKVNAQRLIVPTPEEDSN